MGQTERFYLKGCRKISQGCPINILNCYPWDLRSNNFCFSKDSELSICMSLILNKHTVVQNSFLCSWLKTGGLLAASCLRSTVPPPVSLLLITVCWSIIFTQEFFFTKKRRHVAGEYLWNYNCKQVPKLGIKPTQK